MDSLQSSSTSSDSITLEEEQNPSFFINNNNIHFIREVNRSKFPIYLVHDSKANRQKALKLFPWDERMNQPSQFYLKEIRLSKINHPNIISISDYKIEQHISSHHVHKISYTLMEYAQNGDLFDAIETKKIPFNERLVRSYFQQIVNGVEAIHSHRAAHLDLKLENILLDHDFNAKIADFDMCYFPEDRRINSRGTQNYRAPEIIRGNCQNAQAADIYSLGVILFLLKTNGTLPFAEGVICSGVDLKELLENKPELFFRKHHEITGSGASSFDLDFKQIFLGMTRRNPEDRITIKDLKNSKWWNQEVLPKEKIFSYMSEKFSDFSS